MNVLSKFFIFVACALGGLLGLIVGQATYRNYPSCGPTFTINEQRYKGQTVYWLRRLDGWPWPLCKYKLSSPALFYDVKSAREAAFARIDGDTRERVVATVP